MLTGESKLLVYFFRLLRKYHPQRKAKNQNQNEICTGDNSSLLNLLKEPKPDEDKRKYNERNIYRKSFQYKFQSQKRQNRISQYHAYHHGCY